MGDDLDGSLSMPVTTHAQPQEKERNMTKKGLVLCGLALMLISSASVSSGAGLETSLPGKKWGIILDLPANWIVDKNEVTGDGRGALVRAMSKERTSDGNAMMLTLIIEDAPFPSATAYRDAYAARLWGKNELNMGSKKVKVLYKCKTTSESGPMALFEHVTEADLDGKVIVQKNIFGFLVQDGCAVRVHVSTLLRDPAAEKALWGILKSVRFKEK
jgi:hypothetical protein